MIIDIFVGIVLVIVMGLLLGVPDEGRAGFMAFGIISALAPDADFLFYLWKRYKEGKRVDQFAHEHRDLLHHPFFFCLIGMALVCPLLSWKHAILWVLATLSHFIHDTLYGGWGIRWIPFDDRYFTLASYSPVRVINDLAHQRQIVKEYGDPNWFEKEKKLSRRDKLLLMLAVALSAFWLW